MKIIIFILLINSLFNQVTLNITDYDDSQSSPYLIPYLGGNLKPSLQPNWSDIDFLDQLDDLHIQMLRWPGAEAMNYFDWTQGAFLPCYKWAYTPCYPQNCSQGFSASFCNDEYLCSCSSN